MKYLVAFLPMLLGVELLSLLCLCTMAVFAIYDILKHAPRI